MPITKLRPSLTSGMALLETFGDHPEDETPDTKYFSLF